MTSAPKFAHFHSRRLVAVTVLIFSACSDPPPAVDAGGTRDVPGADTIDDRAVSALVGPAGARLTLGDGAELTVPTGALVDPVILTMARTDDPVPAGYVGHSSVYRFAPSGLTFARAVTVRLPYRGDASRGGLYWSRTGGGFERLSSVDDGSSMQAFATHFSEGFVGTPTADGGTADVPDAGTEDVAGDAGVPLDAPLAPDVTDAAADAPAPMDLPADATGVDVPIDLGIDVGMDVPVDRPADVPALPPDAGPPCVDCAAPRPVAPLTGAHAPLRPRLRWALPTGVEGARIVLCRDRALTLDCVTQLAPGASATVAADLSPGVWFWALRGVRGGATGTATSAVWRLVVGNRPGSGRAWGGDFDFNGDGYADLHYAVPGQHAAVRLSGPAGFNGPAIRFDPPLEATGFGNGSAHGGDVDGDGYADIVVGAPGSATAYVYRGGTTSTLSGTPAWTLRGPAGSGFGQQLLATADLNGDGFSDVLSVGAASGLLWAPGSATGPGALARLSVTIFTCSMVGDTNDDDRDDLLCTDQTTATTTTRALYPGAPTGLGPASVLPGDSQAAQDVNGDGLADVWLDSYRLRLGARGAPTMLPIPAQNGETVLRPGGDLDGDGYSDLLSAGGGNYGSREVYFARGTAAGLGAVEIQHLGCNTRDLGFPLFADTDGNGRDEVLVNVGGSSASSVSLATTTALMERGPTGFEGFGSALTLPTEPGRVVSSIAPAGDINGDGYADVVLTHARYTSSNFYADTTDPTVTVAYGGPTALRAAPTPPRLAEATSNLPLRAVSVGDLNGDRGADLVLYTRDVVRLFLTTGGALPTTGTIVTTGLGTVSSVVALGDVNGDGRPDLAVNALSESGVLLFGIPGGFGAPTRLTPTAPSLFYDGYAAAGDFDRNGVADVIALGRNNTETDLSFHRGTATGLSPVATWRVPGIRGVPRPMGDLNGDGYNDLAVAATPSTNPVLVIGGPSGPTRVAAAPTRDYLASPWDWNRDGRADALAFDPFPARIQLEIHFGDAAAVISPASSGLCRFPLQDNWLVEPVGDVDGDGTPDLAASASYVNTAVRNNQSPPELLRVILVGRRSTGPAPLGIPGFDGTQALR